MRPYEFGGGNRLEQRIIAIGVTVSMTAFLPWLEDICSGRGQHIHAGGSCSGSWSRWESGDIFENMLWIEEFGVDMSRREEIRADHENFSGNISMRVK